MDDLACEICTENFDESVHKPRVLSCGHTYCHSCLEKILQNHQNYKFCPYCKTLIQYERAVLIPINYNLKSLSNKHEKSTDTLRKEIKSLIGKLLTEGYHEEHNYFNELLTRTSAVEQTCHGLKKQISKEVEKELVKRGSTDGRLNESLKELENEKKSLLEEIRQKQLAVQFREKRIQEIKSLKVTESKICENLKLFLKSIEKSKNLNILEPKKIKTSPNLQLLEALCQKGSVYAVESRYDGKRYGKVEVKDGRIWIYSFQLDKPNGANVNIFNFKEFLSWFCESTQLPKTGFLQISCIYVSKIVDIEVIIETEGFSPRAKNFILICSGLRGSAYKGAPWNHSCYRPKLCGINQGPPPVMDGIRDDKLGAPREKAGVYGMSEKDSWFDIQLMDDPSQYCDKFGNVIYGFQSLKCQRGYCTVKECGLIISTEIRNNDPQ